MCSSRMPRRRRYAPITSSPGAATEIGHAPGSAGAPGRAVNTNLTPALAGSPSPPARASETALRSTCWVASGSSSSASITSRTGR